MRILFSLSLILLLASCGSEQTKRSLQGYVEGYKLVLAPRTSGVLVRVTVAEGDRVQAGKILFVVDSRLARARLDEAVAARAAAEARLMNLKKGGRPQAIQAAAETLKSTQATLVLARQSYGR
ncbi:MAG: biotin/lipoyl-binding protein, partial [Alphaproteobacteria bacterium]|nr:biotin/lipoyl-binding protein [Alphaproteobacteria bacterium]